MPPRARVTPEPAPQDEPAPDPWFIAVRNFDAYSAGRRYQLPDDGRTQAWERADLVRRLVAEG